MTISVATNILTIQFYDYEISALFLSDFNFPKFPLRDVIPEMDLIMRLRNLKFYIPRPFFYIRKITIVLYFEKLNYLTDPFSNMGQVKKNRKNRFFAPVDVIMGNKQASVFRTMQL